jgi:tRNA(adenine34) deaminase
MCAGAVVQARLERVVFGCRDPKAGALGSVYDVAAGARLNHRFAVTAGVEEERCRELMRDFFRRRR